MMMRSGLKALRFLQGLSAIFALGAFVLPAQAEIDGHGPDAWRVTGVAANDALNARMGPGTSYLVISQFAPDERGMQQVTCVPLLTAGIYGQLTQAQLDALPARWCLMRSADFSRAGWVAQRYITPDDTVAGPVEPARSDAADLTGDEMIDSARALVEELYAAQARFEQGRGADPLQGRDAAFYFTDEITSLLRSGGVGAHPLYGAQDFDGSVQRIAADGEQPMLRGMITINVDFTNFGEPQRASFFLRADPDQPGASLRIFRVEHEGWAYP